MVRQRDPAPLTAIRAGRLERWLFRTTFALLAALAAALSLTHRYLPLVDWPEHLAQDAIVARAHDPASPFAGFYRTTGWFLPYQGFRWLHIALARLVGDDALGGRLALVAYLVGAPLATLGLVRRLGRDRWVALVAFVLVVDGNLLWGFAPHALATVFVLAALCLAIDALERGGALRYAALGLAGVGLFFTHAQQTLLALLLVAALCIASRASPARRAGVLAALVPAGALLAVYLVGAGWVTGSAVHDEFATGGRALWHAPWRALRLVAYSAGLTVYGRWPWGSYLAALLAVVLGAWRTRALRSDAGEPRPRYALALAAALALLFLALPAEWRGQSVAPRLASTLLASLAWLVPMDPPRTAAASRALAPSRALLALCAFASLAYAHARFARFDASARAIEPVLARVPSGATVGALVFDPFSPGFRLPVLLHAGGYAVALRHARVSSGFTRTGVGYDPAVPRDALTVRELWLPSERGWRPSLARVGPFWQYALVVTGERAMGSPLEAAAGFEAHRVVRSGRFELWAIARR